MEKLTGPRPEGHPCWLDLTVPDVTSAAAFYERVFEWTYKVSGEEFGHYHLAHVQEDRMAAGLGQPMTGADAPSAWTLYFAAADVDAMTERAVSLGGNLVVPAMDIRGSGRMTIVADPTGAVFGLWQAKGHDGFGAAHAPGTMSWCEANTTDAERATAFYTELLGATSRQREGADTPTHVLSRDGEEFASIVQMNDRWAGMPPHWMAYFEVADAAAAAAAVRDAGGAVHHGPFDSEHGRLVVVADPYGAAFSLQEPPAG